MWSKSVNQSFTPQLLWDRLMESRLPIATNGLSNHSYIHTPASHSLHFTTQLRGKRRASDFAVNCPFNYTEAFSGCLSEGCAATDPQHYSTQCSAEPLKNTTCPWRGQCTQLKQCKRINKRHSLWFQQSTALTASRAHSRSISLIHHIKRR